MKSFSAGMRMQQSRRYLPSMSLLTAFEAAARTGSVTKAAKELDLTQSAVSRQIRSLEDQLETQLFIRKDQTIRLSPAGITYAREISECLARIGNASLNLFTNPLGGTFNLAILPTFGTRWLAPRLPEFLADNPGITINLMTRLSRFDFQVEAIDAAIHFGHTDWPGAEAVLLRTEYVIPACSPEIKNRYKFESPSDLNKVTLLHLATRAEAWDRWFRIHNCAIERTRGMLFDQFATAAQASMAGVGVALLPTFLIEDELKSGQLVHALDLPLKSSEAYYLVWPTERTTYPPLEAFRNWLLLRSAPYR